MVKIAHRFLLLLIAAVSLSYAVTHSPDAVAQAGNEPGGFKNVELSIYPEYDDPRLLVMLEGQIVGAQPPAKVRFLVPSAAEMYSAGSMDAQGRYSGGPPARKPSAIAGWDEISYEVKTDTFRMEYYDPIIKGAPDKTIAYEFRTLYPISGLSVIVQEPRNSSTYSVQPTGQISSDKGGFIIYQYNYSELKGDAPLKFEISYTKSDPRPSLEIEKGTSKSSTESESSTSLVILIVVAVLVAGGGLFLILKSMQSAMPKRRNKARAVAPGGKTKEKSPPTKYCEECGESIPGSARFCPNCGERQQ